MQGFSSRVQGLLQLLKEGEREELIAKLDPEMAKKLKERREKETGMPGKGGLNPELDKKIHYRGNGVPEAQELGNAMLESAGRYHLQNNPPEVKFSEEDSEDFATCERPDGSKYGTGGQCRKGKETTPGSEEKPKKYTPKQIADAEAKLAKLKEKSDKASFEAKFATDRKAKRSIRAGQVSVTARLHDKASKAWQAYKAQKDLVNEMKGIKPKPQEAPKKTAAQAKQEKRRELETKINKRAKDLADKHGKDSDQYKKFVAKYGPKLRKLQDEIRANMFA